MNKPTTYSISVQVRDKDGKILKNERDIKVPSIDFELTVHNDKQLVFQMERIHRQFKTITTDCDVNLEASLHNGISDTWMCMASYYGSEKRFVKH